MRAIGQLGNKYPIIRILARETARKLGPREQEGTRQPERPLHVWSRTLNATTAQSMKLSHRNSSLREREPKDWKDWHSKVWVRRQSTTDQQPKSGDIGMWEERKSSSHVKNHGEQEIKNSSSPINVWEYRWDNVTRWPQVSSSDTNDAAQQGGCRMVRKECGLKNYIQ